MAFPLQDMGMGHGSSESCEETIELQPRTTSNGSQYQRRVAYDVHDEKCADDMTSSPKLSKVGGPTADGSRRGPPSNRRPPDSTNINVEVEDVPVEILINLQDDTQSFHRDDTVKNVPTSTANSNGPIVSNGQVSGKNKEKHLTFSESTEQLLSTKSSPSKENGTIVSGSVSKDDAGRVICVNVNKHSLKSSTPLQVDSHVVKKTNKGKEQETML